MCKRGGGAASDVRVAPTLRAREYSWPAFFLLRFSSAARNSMRQETLRVCLVVAGLTWLAGCAMPPREQAPPPLSLIPAPVLVERQAGYFEARDGTPIVVRGGTEGESVAEWFA